MIKASPGKRILIIIAQTIQTTIFILLIPLFVVLVVYTRLRNAILGLLGKKPHILWGPVPIINISHNSKADRTQGYKSDCLVYRPYHITQNDLFDYNLEKYFKYRITTILIPFIVMIWAALKYDIFHFFYNGGYLYSTTPILLRAEFVLWKVMGKRVIVTAYGADVRLESVTRKLGKYNAYMDMTHEDVIGEVGLTENEIKSRVEWIMKYASYSVSMGDMIEYTPGSHNDLFYWAIDTDDWEPIYETNNEKVKILHAPNHTHYKGTRFLLPVIERLKQEGYPIEFILVQGMTNAEARKHYEQADIIAEQFIIGWHGFFAIEAMALGKPVLCYIHHQHYLPSWTECPIVNTTPDNLYDNLVKLITNPDLRKEVGHEGRKFVEEVYSLDSVGKRLDKIYKSLY